MTFKIISAYRRSGWFAAAFLGGWACSQISNQAAGADLPEWFEQNRVQAHSETYHLQDAGAGVEWHAPIREAGARAVTLIVDNMDEGAWWPSAVGETAPLARTDDVVRRLVTSVHGQGMKCIGYFRYMSDAWAQTNHPEWICRDAGGLRVREPRGKREQREVDVLCANSPYREFIQTRLCELAERGVDMIYFDSWHMPEVCTCESCRQKFERKTGRGFPELKPPSGLALNGVYSLGGVYSEDYLQVSRFVSESLIETFAQWRAAVRKINPEIRFAIGSSLYPFFLTQPQLTADFLAIADTSKTEFKKEFGGNAEALREIKPADAVTPEFDIQTALGWSLVRDSSGGRPPLMWIPIIKSEEDALRASAAAYSYGCIASMAFHQPVDDIARFRSTFVNGAKVSPALANTRPYGWMAIHISERARNRRLNDLTLVWKEVSAPVIGSFTVAVREHLPVVTINDAQLADGIPAETRVLVLASPDDLDERQQASVSRWTSAGGVAIRLPAGQDWHTAAGKAARMEALREEVRARAGRPPVRIAGPAGMHAVCFRHPEGGRFVIALVNAWDDYAAKPRGPTPPECRDVTIEVDRTFFPATRASEMLTDGSLPLTGEHVMKLTVPPFAINRCILLEN